MSLFGLHTFACITNLWMSLVRFGLLRFLGGHFESFCFEDIRSGPDFFYHERIRKDLDIFRSFLP